MPFFSRSRTKPAFTGPATVSTDRDRRTLSAQLRRGLDELARRVEVPGTTVLDAQLVLQVVGSASYQDFRGGWDKAWRKQGGTYTTKNWPARLDDGMIAVLLLPLSAGRVGPAVGKHPRVVAAPLFSKGRPAAAGWGDACLSILTSWVSNPAEQLLTARLAPPVIEVVRGGRVVERAVETFGATWPLPVPDGL